MPRQVNREDASGTWYIAHAQNACRGQANDHSSPGFKVAVRQLRTNSFCKQNGPKAVLFRLLRQALRPRLTLLVDDNRSARRSGQLHAVLLAPEVIGDVPVIGSSLAR